MKPLAFIFATLLSLVGCTSSQTCVPGVDELVDSNTLAGILDLLGAEVAADLEVCELDGFSVVRDRETNKNSILVLRGSDLFFFADESHSVPMAFVFESGTPKVSLSDKNNDGAFDHLSYVAPELDGVGGVTVFDNDWNGEADWRIEQSKGRRDIYRWYDNAWRQAVRENGIAGVMVDDEFVAIGGVEETLDIVTP